jgi:hypothetical protein
MILTTENNEQPDRASYMQQGCHVDDNGRMDDRMMAAGSSVTWTHYSVHFEVTGG